MLVVRDQAGMQATLDRNYPLNTPLLDQGPEACYHEALKVLTCEVDIESFLIAINLP